MSRFPYPGEYTVTSHTIPLERAIAQAAGLRIVEPDAEGRITQPLSEYLADDNSLLDRKWSAVADEIRNGLTPPATEPDAKPTMERAPARFIRGDLGGIEITRFADGSECTHSTGTRSRFVEPALEIKPRTFDPFKTDMQGYVEARSKGLTPSVHINTSSGRADLSESFDLDAYREYREATASRGWMDDWRAARERGEVPEVPA